MDEGSKDAVRHRAVTDRAKPRGRGVRGLAIARQDRTKTLTPANQVLVEFFLVKKAHKEGTQLSSRDSAEQVSELTTNRLSVYLRSLNVLDAAGVRTVSSQALAEQFHLNAAQIRKDLAYFGEFGVRGVGYYVKELRRHLRQILGIDRGVCVAIMGAGNLGLALADYPGFRDEGFEIVAMFDSSRDKVGHRSRGGVPIYDARELRKVARRERIRIAVIAVPAAAAERREYGRDGGHQGDSEFFARGDQGSGRSQVEEHGSDRLARKPLVLPGAGE